MRSPLAGALLLLLQLTFPATSQPSSTALEELSAILQEYVARDMVVGAEMLIVHDGRTVLQEAFGWQDRESVRELEPNTLFNVRSMTQPLTGAAIQILIDDGLLRLDDPVAAYLPSFANDRSAAITIRHLLTHTSGLPLNIVYSFSEFPSLLALAERAGQIGPQFEPGSGFYFSDTGIDVLAAIVEVVSGESLDRFIRKRLLEPLGMKESLFYPSDGSPPGPVCSLYEGQMGSWIRSWKPGDPTLYPYALGSQGLYCSARDYARFLGLWLSGGLAPGGERLLSERAVRDTLEPVEPALNPASTTPFPTGFPGMQVRFGQTAFLYLPEGDEDENQAPVVIGHSGVDGTSAWAWPEERLMVLLFTQCRGTSIGLRLEWEIDRLLIHPERPAAETPADFQPYLGTYVADFGPHDNERFTVLFRDGGLALDIPSQGVYRLREPDLQGRWRFVLSPEEAVSFQPADGNPAGWLKLHRGAEEIWVPREGTAALFRQDQQRRKRLESWHRYLGLYRDEAENADMEVALRGGRLALLTPDGREYLLLPPTAGRWAFLVNPAMGLFFEEKRGGPVLSCTISYPGGERRILPRSGDRSP